MRPWNTRLHLTGGDDVAGTMVKGVFTYDATKVEKPGVP